ncbi:MAG: HlyC/CorC family transporter [Phreatobacter sp.]|uniref:HlyC/CorC family transporter n=1 Tax=Phreatobacter sp. TaxID=1966341 RepID=UPI001A41C045|nr:HlyC/CorC family transporter [Phreatobacter sp.]MBL8568036.1 HlyC/CorC family transporter [Phreatobacter sp.]
MDVFALPLFPALFLIAIGLLLAAMSSAARTAIAAVSRSRMTALEAGGNRRAGLVIGFMDKRERLVAALVIGRAALLVAVTVLAASLSVAAFGVAGLAYAALGMLCIIVVFAEVLPRTIATLRPERTALLLARPTAVAMAVLEPVAAALDAAVRGVLRLCGIQLGAASASSGAEELRGAVDLMHKEGSFEKLDRDMVGGILDLKDLTVLDVMVHRTKMVTIDVGDAPAKVVRDVLAAPYTRIPLWRDSSENIIGVLHGKDLLRALAAAGGDAATIDVASLALPAWFVPESTSLQDQLKAFLRRKTHFAMVVDEYGDMMGLVTLEDIIEEIVGDIRDEHDVQVTGVRPQRDGSVNVDGAVPVRDLNRVMDWRLPDEEATTIAGLVIHEARSIPEAGQAFTFHGFRFQVLRRQRNRITALKITPLDQVATA